MGCSESETIWPSRQCFWWYHMAMIACTHSPTLPLKLYHPQIGFGTRGPGCMAPARFIDMQPYFNWINSATTSAEEMYDSPDYRRIDGMEFVPAHELFTWVFINYHQPINFLTAKIRVLPLRSWRIIQHASSVRMTNMFTWLFLGNASFLTYVCITVD